MRRDRPWLVVVLVGAVVGVVFAGVSTYDFVQHLDRQVHNLHCSFIPGVSHGAGESGCQVAMMSPYSSVFRTHVWGGIPISLAAMSVFAFLVFYTLDLAVTRRKNDPRATGFLALATALPALASLVMLVLSLVKLGTTCKLCVCIYVASAVCLIGGLAAWRRAVRDRRAGAPMPDPRTHRRDRHHDEPAFVGTAKAASGAHLVAVSVETGAASTGFLAAMFGMGVLFVAIPIALYLAMAPDHARFIGTCEGLPRPDDSYGVMVRIDRGPPRGAPTIEVLDPLCPACRAFEQRLVASGLADQLDRKAVLFPLDNTCNWMVTEATHPGACTVSEAVLCAGAKAPDVIAWAFEEQERIRGAAKTDPAAAARIVKQRFPELASCVGSPDARSRLNKSMRWIVANNIRVLTPQLFIDNVKLCDEDVDLGLEYTLSNMLDRHARGTLAPVPLEKTPSKSAADKADPAGATGSAGDPAGSASLDKASPGSASAGKALDNASPDKASLDKPSPDKASPDKASDSASPDKASPDKASDSASSDKASPDKASDSASSDSASSDKASPDKASSDKASDRASPDKASPDKASSDNALSNNASSDNASPDKAPSDKASPDKASPDKASPDNASSSDAVSGKPSSDKASGKASSDKASPDKAVPRKVPPRKPTSNRASPKTSPDKASSDKAPLDGPVTRPDGAP